MFRKFLLASFFLIVVLLYVGVYWLYIQMNDNFAIVSPNSFQTFQRNWESNTASIPLVIETTAHTEENLSIDVQWMNVHYSIQLSKSVNPCETIFSTNADNTNCVQYTGQIENLFSGRGNLLVTLGQQIAIIHALGIGDVFVLAGQSNAVGYAVNPQEYAPMNGLTASMFTLRGDWMQLDDHILADALLTGEARNSHWPLLATQITDYTGVPVAFIPTAHGALALELWSINGPLNRIVRQQIIDSEAHPLIVLWHQGESDVINQTPQDRYFAMLMNLADRWHEEFNVSILAANLGPIQRDTVTPESLEAIRSAIVQSWNESPYIYPGADMSDVDHLYDGVHFRTDEEAQLLADSWFQALIDFGLPRQ